jgi:hypothetical protein
MFAVGDVCQKVVTCAIWWCTIMQMENPVCPSAEPGEHVWHVEERTRTEQHSFEGS